jgi:predicted RNA binding protein YcfA (HicA-like mRNA interferase family)
METDSRRIIARLEQEGWALKSSKGSHHKFERDGHVVVVPHPKKDLPVGTARAIAKSAGWI